MSRWVFHFTPTSARRINAMEGFFAKLTKRRLKRGVFRSIFDLQAAEARAAKLVGSFGERGIDVPTPNAVVELPSGGGGCDPLWQGSVRGGRDRSTARRHLCPRSVVHVWGCRRRTICEAHP